MLRKLLTLMGLCFALTLPAALRSNAQTDTNSYHAYVSGSSTTATDTLTYFLSDIQNGSQRDIYISFNDAATGTNCHTSNPAGKQIAGYLIGTDGCVYWGTMYMGKKLYPFQLNVYRCSAAPSGFAADLQIFDKRTGVLMMERIDLLDAGATVILNV